MTEYRIDELARAAGTTTRNVRAYRERGLLPPPDKRGRVGIYTDAHLARLRLIDILLQRGYTTSHIADFIEGWESGKNLTEVLGLQQAVTEPWSSSDEGTTVSVSDARAMLDDPDGVQLSRLVTYGLARVDGDQCTFTDPKLLQGFVSLAGYGFGVDALMTIHERLYSAINTISKDMISTVKQHIESSHGQGWIPENDDIQRTTEMLQIMRTLAVDSVNSILGRTLDQNLQEQLGEYLQVAIDNSRRSGRNSA
ncbi:MerR family transcriptional regulator [Gordonia sp. zg691]|uniref:MerR family transcriptional regulator n=1 Tax=Gordonia jinghuaiqii TaxID=2758710 RepID=A0A7D7QHT1_9ACTN|nr:MerR family transcriptional regulator [Gordonia jinghuaiqii]MBD0862801.1 MerR family transcriptional regulator [Gordonia jinghuaiqii]MCR5979075.1 MerR family transcriptional regulator [Gordonia jinghuaiqii]QMT01604.1 MerR family transcriptional regulator [Gordonia jinghuaiqii]